MYPSYLHSRTRSTAADIQVRLPYTVLPDDAASALANSHDGILVIRLTVDKSPPSQQADAGSKAWLLSRALSRGQESKAAGEGGQEARMKCSTMALGKAAAEGEADALPEERFHLKLPKGTGTFLRGMGYRCKHALTGMGWWNIVLY